MTTVERRAAGGAGGDDADRLIERAARAGFILAEFETSTGQRVLEWRRGDEPRPQFATERVARQWMAEWLDRTEPEGSTGPRPATG